MNESLSREPPTKNCLPQLSPMGQVVQHYLHKGG